MFVGKIILNFPFYLYHKQEDQPHGMFCFENTLGVVRTQLIITEY